MHARMLACACMCTARMQACVQACIPHPNADVMACPHGMSVRHHTRGGGAELMASTSNVTHMVYVPDSDRDMKDKPLARVRACVDSCVRPCVCARTRLIARALVRACVLRFARARLHTLVHTCACAYVNEFVLATSMSMYAPVAERDATA